MENKPEYINLVVEPCLGAAGCYWHTGAPCDQLRKNASGGFECVRHGVLKTHTLKVSQPQPLRADSCGRSAV
jgi:hypothetical protein